MFGTHKYNRILTLIVASIIAIIQPYSVFAQHVVKAANASDNTGKVNVKWFAEGLYNEEGFNVYRQTKGGKNWIRVNETPVLKQKDIPEQQMGRDEELKAFVKLVNELFPAPLPDMAVLLVLIKSAQSEPFARFIGITIQDDRAQRGEKYTYKVTMIKRNKEETVGISNEVTAGDFSPEPQPNGFTVKALNGSMGLSWQPEPNRLYGYNLYKGLSSAKESMTLLNKKPILLFDSKDKNGQMKKPEYFYTDREVESGKTYYYQLAGLDVFGNESLLTPAIPSSPADSTPPPNVTNLKATAVDKNVNLTWNAPDAPDLKGYFVAVGSSADGPFKKLNQEALTATSYTHTPPGHGVYYYKVTGIDQAGNDNSGSITLAEIVDTDPPLPPTGLKGTAVSGLVTLSWNPTTSEDFWGYYVLRAVNVDETSKYVRVNSDPLRATGFSDKVPKEVDNKLFYRVIAMDSSAIESQPSEPIEVMMPDVTPPPPPFIKLVQTEVGKNTIIWMPSLCHDLVGYQVYRASGNDSANFTLLNKKLLDTTATTFIDQDPGSAKINYYKVLSVDDADNVSESSNIYPATTKLNMPDAVAPRQVTAKFNESDKAVVLKWKLDKSDELSGIIVYKGEAGGKVYPATGLINDNQYQDKEITKQKTYSYQVRALYSNGLIGRSETINLTIK